MVILKWRIECKLLILKIKPLIFPFRFIAITILIKKTQVIFIIIIGIGFIITTLFALMIEKYWGIMVYLLLVIAFYIAILMSKNPLMVIYPEKLVFKNSGIGNSKTLDWQDCHLETTTLKRDFGDIPLLNFLSKRNDGKMERIFYLVLNNVRFDNEHFDKDDTLKFFEKIQQGAY